MSKEFYKTISKPVENANLVVLSLGAGVQSSTMALMAARGDIGPMPDCAIFADTGWEPQHIYDWLIWLEKQLPFPIHQVQVGNIKTNTLEGMNSTGQRFASLPFYMKKGQRATKFRVEQWMGISTDEITRMKDTKDKWLINRWPLIEEDMTRIACLKWMAERQYPKPQKSSCIGCPFHGDSYWREMRDNRPEEFEEAVQFDKMIRTDQRGKFKTKQYLHSSMKPLGDVNFDNAEDKGQGTFLDECDGVCGV